MCCYGSAAQRADTSVVTMPADFEQVLEAAQRGEEWAVGVLFDATNPRLLAFLRWREPAAADDLVGEVWLAVAERLAAFQGDEGKFRAWVFAIARHRLADHRRRRARSRTTLVEPGLLDTQASAGDPATTVVEEHASIEAIARIGQLVSPEQAEVVILRVVGGLSVEETAEVLGKRPGTIRVLQHRALRRLARQLGVHDVAEV